MSALAKDLIQRLLMKDPKKRLGCGPRDADEIKEHHFFQVKCIAQMVFFFLCALLFWGSLNMVPFVVSFFLFSRIFCLFKMTRTLPEGS